MYPPHNPHTSPHTHLPWSGLRASGTAHPVADLAPIERSSSVPELIGFMDLGMDEGSDSILGPIWIEVKTRFR